MRTMRTAPNGSSPPKPLRPRADDGRRQRQIATKSAVPQRYECAFQRRFSAETMAVSDAVMVFVLMPTP